MKFFEKDELTQLTALRTALAQAMKEDLNILHLITLLSVAVEPGLSVNDLAQRIDAPQQTASRNVSMLMGRYEQLTGSRPRVNDPFLDQTINENDPRSRSLLLTRSGKKFISDLLLSLRPKS